MELLSYTTNPFGGVLTETESLPGDPEVFRARLGHSLDAWRGEGYRLVWVEIPLSLASLVPVAAEAGFTYHHSGETYVMMTLRLKEAAFIPAHASHYIGAGGVVLSEDQGAAGRQREIPASAAGPAPLQAARWRPTRRRALGRGRCARSAGRDGRACSL